MDLSTIEQRLNTLSDKLDLFINGSADQVVNTSVGAVKTLSGIQEELFRTRGLVPCTVYQTLADLPSVADLNTVARVSNDGTNNGLYIRKVGTWERYGWQDLQYFVPSEINQNNYDVFFTSSDMVLGKNLIQTDVPYSTVKNTMLVYDIEILSWQNVSANGTPSAETRKYEVLVMSRDVAEMTFVINNTSTSQLGTPIGLSIAGLKTSVSGNNTFTLKLTASGGISDVFGVAKVKLRRLDGQVW